MSSCMEACPPELLLHIFTFACTDDGSTGRALSRVSRYIAATSAPVRYQSIALVGVHAISAFAARLSALPPSADDDGRRVRNLFVSQSPRWQERWHSVFDSRSPDNVEGNISVARGWVKPSNVPNRDLQGRLERIGSHLDICTDPQMRDAVRKKRYDFKVQYSEMDSGRRGIVEAQMGEVLELRQALRIILGAVSPYLRTLTLLVPATQITCGPLPNLENLTIQSLNQWQKLNGRQPLPALRCLHIMKAKSWSTQPREIAAIATSLTHLCLSGVGDDPDIGQRFATALGIVLPKDSAASSPSMDGPEGDSALPPEPLLPQLRKLVICFNLAVLNPSDRGGEAADIFDREQRMENGLAILMEVDARIELRRSQRFEDGLETYWGVAEDWQDTACGREGCFRPQTDNLTRESPAWASR